MRLAGIVSWGREGLTAEGPYPVFTRVGYFAGVTQPCVDDSDWCQTG